MKYESFLPAATRASEAIRKMANWLLWSLPMAVSFFGSDFLLRWQERTYAPRIDDYLTYVIIALLSPLIARHRLGLLLLGLLLAVQCTEIAYFRFFGVFYGPNELLLLFVETKDILEGAIGMFGQIWIGAAWLILGFGMLALLGTRAPKYSLAISTGALLLFSWLLYTSARVTHEELASGVSRNSNPDNRRLLLKNGIKAISFASARFTFQELSGISPRSFGSYQPYRVQPIARDNLPSIIVVMGESLNPDHMSALGYGRETTPSLQNMLNEYKGLAFRSMSAAVVTRVSIPAFFGIVREPDNTTAYRSGDTNLFRLAKMHGYQTAFLSTQGMEYISNYIGLRWIDFWHDVAWNDPATRGKVGDTPDNVLLGLVKQQSIDFHYPYFLVLNTASAHGPYNTKFSTAKAIFSARKTGNAIADTAAEYDDAMLQFDSAVGDALRYAINQTPGNLLIVIVSDHGERVGKDGRFGHGVLDYEVGKIPTLVFGHNADALVQTFRRACPTTHYDIARFLAAAIGFDVINPNDDGSRFLNGIDLFGLAGHIHYQSTDVPFERQCMKSSES